MWQAYIHMRRKIVLYSLMYGVYNDTYIAILHQYCHIKDEVIKKKNIN